MPPVEKVLKMIAKGREQARKATDRAEALARETAAVSGAQATKRVRKLRNAIVAVKRHRAGASAGEKRLSQLAFPEQLRAQQASLAEINLTLARLEASFLPRPADAETMQRALAAQSAAVADVVQQLRDVNDRVESIKRQARILEARRRLGV